MTEEELSEITKSKVTLNPNGLTIDEKKVTIKGKQLEEVKEIFDKVWNSD